MIKVIRRENEPGEKLLRRFSKHVKSRRLQKDFRRIRYFSPKPKKRMVRQAAIAREGYRAAAKKQAYMQS